MLGIDLPSSGKTVWTTVWPTEEGVYWFYGFPWGKSEQAAFKHDKPDLLCVLVRRIANGFLYVTEGYTIGKYGADSAVGFWTPVVLPDKPCAANTTDDGKTFRG